MKTTPLAWGLALCLYGPPLAAQEMPAPDVKPGDQWTYRETDLLTLNETGRITETVTAVDGGTSWVDSRRTARTWWRGEPARQLHLEQLAFAEGSPDQRGKTLTTSDGGCAYPWPLKVGAQFECTEAMQTSNGWKLRYEMKFSVDAAEAVDTPAGRFDTLRVVAKGWVNNLTTNINSRHERVIWLAPAVRREVKHEIRTFLPNGRPYRVEGRELLAFKRQD
jgi:hypothetical protein